MVSSGTVVWEIQAGKGRASFPVTFFCSFFYFRQRNDEGQATMVMQWRRRSSIFSAGADIWVK